MLTNRVIPYKDYSNQNSKFKKSKLFEEDKLAILSDTL